MRVKNITRGVIYLTQRTMAPGSEAVVENDHQVSECLRTGRLKVMPVLNVEQQVTKAPKKPELITEPRIVSGTLVDVPEPQIAVEVLDTSLDIMLDIPDIPGEVILEESRPSKRKTHTDI